MRLRSDVTRLKLNLVRRAGNKALLIRSNILEKKELLFPFVTNITLNKKVSKSVNV